MGDGGIHGSAHKDLRMSSVVVRLGGDLLSRIGDGVGEGGMQGSAQSDL